MAMLDDVATYIDANNALTVGDDLIKGGWESEPDNQVALFEYPGNTPVQGMGDQLPTEERPRLQVHSRSKDYIWARDRCEEIWRLLMGVVGKKLPDSSGREYTMESQDSPYSIGQDGQGFVHIVCNFKVTKELT